MKYKINLIGLLYEYLNPIFLFYLNTFFQTIGEWVIVYILMYTNFNLITFFKMVHQLYILGGMGMGWRGEADYYL